MSAFVRQSRFVFGRSARGAARQLPVLMLAPTLLAVLILALFDALYGDIAAVSGYPAGSFAEWVAPAAVLLSVFLGAGPSAASIVADVNSGYADRLRLAGGRPAAMLAGRVAFDAVRALPPAAAVAGISLALGARAEGLPGVLALCAALAVAWNGIFYAAALTTLQPAVIQALQPVTFMPAVMFSSFWVPVALMPDWYAWIVEHNPVTPVIDAARSTMLGATDWGDALAAAIVLAVLAGATYAVAVRALTRSD